ncbi:hypothetical protein DEJ47_32770 [Streptomyces venezuelae]|uniref:Uncharacterized protein n=1 Tax=Streptomyces venezuelae TaxID=54571 RepID=A0A5P2BJF7_STRVZ|nr:hypothetical protein DEJ47_32770 [Streptomyces venezuelae]
MRTASISGPRSSFGAWWPATPSAFVGPPMTSTPGRSSADAPGASGGIRTSVSEPLPSTAFRMRPG